MKIWTVANQKGGVGKTTTTVSLGGASCASGRRTLLLDLDPHGSLTAYFGYEPESMEHSVYDLFQSGRFSRSQLDDLLLETYVEGLYLLPAATALATLERQLGQKDGMGLTIARALDQVKDVFDLAIIDCPPMLGVLMVNALAACEHLVIPVQTEFLAVKGLQRMQSTLHMIERARKISVPYTIVPTMYDQRTRASVDTLKHLRVHYKKHVWSSLIPVDTLFRDASRAGEPLTQLEPGARGAQAYRDLFAHLMGEPVVVVAEEAVLS